MEKFLRRKGLTQTALARIVGTTPANVSKWVVGLGVPSYEFCQKLIASGMTTEELFGVPSPAVDKTEPSNLDGRVIEIIIKALQKSL